MIHKLSFWGHPTVPDTKVSFSSGFNLLHAPNGRGKSTILELIAYSLFGTEALRASAGQEYPSLSTDLTLTVNNKAYQIVRSKKRTELLEQGVVLAVGTTAVNAFILRLFGYNGKVYNVANYVRQDHVKALTHVLRADDRRKVLENTIGLGIIDNVVKELGDSLRGLTAEAKGEPLKHQLLFGSQAKLVYDNRLYQLTPATESNCTAQSTLHTPLTLASPLPLPLGVSPAVRNC